MPRFAIVLIIALLIAKVAGVIAQGPSPLVMDAGGYWELGEMAAQGDWMLTGEPIAYRTPMYPWLIAATQLAFDRSLFALCVIQGILWLATIGMIAWMAWQWTGDRRNVWVVLLASLPMLSSVVYVSAALTETLFTFLLVAHLATTLFLARRPSVGSGLLAGATLGAAVLTRPIAMLLWIPGVLYLILVWYFLPHESGAPCRKRGWISVVVGSLVCVAMLAPWVLRNQSLFGKPFLTEFVGRNIWIVTFQDGSGAGLDLPESDAARTLQRAIDEKWAKLETNERWRDTWTVSNALTDSGIDDANADQMMKTVALDALGDNAPSASWKAARRCVNFWRTRATELPRQLADLDATNQPLEKLYRGEATWGRRIGLIDTALRFRASNSLFVNTLLMIAAGAGTILLIVWRRTRAGGLWLGAVLVYFGSVTGLLEIPAYRYRMVVEPILLLVLVTAYSPFLLRKPSDA